MLDISTHHKPPVDTLFFTYNPEKGRYKGQSFIGHGKMNPDPFHDSKEIKCFFKRKEKLPGVNNDDLPYIFFIDVDNNKYIHKNITEKTQADNEKFAEEFIEQLTEQDWWKWINSWLFNYKSYISDNIDANNCSITATFPVYDLEKEGIVIGYHEILPSAETWSYEDDENYYLILDQYCLDPGCPCTEAVLMVVPWINDEMKRDDEMVIRFDYQKNSWEMQDSPFNKQYHLDSLFPEIMKSIPDLTGQLKKRHDILKKIYNRYKEEKNISSENIKKTKIGRNDPCPCGSGKKYKKCCKK